MEREAKNNAADRGRPAADTLPVIRSGILKYLALCLAMFAAACSELEQPQPEPFFAETKPPAVQEFRWSNGPLPKTIDPAFAAAPPETDVVRAVYEGLTETDSKTLREIPGIAESWVPSDNFRVWTFSLRKDARWSNGAPVTAHDFVRSWKRLAELGDRVPHRSLLRNLVGMARKADPSAPPESLPDFLTGERTDPGSASTEQTNSNRAIGPSPTPQQQGEQKPTQADKFGAVAISDHTLRVTLILPDEEFPRLAANAVFRPVFGNVKESGGNGPDPATVTNGAFKITEIGADGIRLERSDNYWNRREVKLERVIFVPSDSAEAALAAYRNGDLDAVTNAEFEPLAQKLLAPYDDFRRTTHSALNFYTFNLDKAPFADRRVREALAIAIDRERLTEGEMKGSTQPALNFLPFDESDHTKLTQDADRARDLLERSGFPNGENFPTIKLLVNRNDMQIRIARSVAKMWLQNLNIQTDIVVEEAAQLEAVKRSGEYDVMRRGVVLPTTDDVASFISIFDAYPVEHDATDSGPVSPAANMPPGDLPPGGKDVNANSAAAVVVKDAARIILTEEDALFELHAIPLYFPTSYSLVKPYVHGFDINGLDSPLLRDVVIDNNWQPK